MVQGVTIVNTGLQIGGIFIFLSFLSGCKNAKIDFKDSVSVDKNAWVNFSDDTKYKFEKSSGCNLLDDIFSKKFIFVETDKLYANDLLKKISVKYKINILFDADDYIIQPFAYYDISLIDFFNNFCTINDKRWEIINNNTIKILDDYPYTKNYDIRFLNLNRKFKNTSFVSTGFGEKKGSVLKFENNLDFQLSDDLQNLLKKSIDERNFYINQNLGLIWVNGYDFTHKIVQDTINFLKKKMDKKVLIEAKIIEINYNKNNEFKIDIDGLLQNPTSFVSQSKISNIKNFNETISILNTKGQMKTIANTKIMVSHNCPAYLKMAKDEIYFDLKIEKNEFKTESKNKKIKSAKAKSIPIGMILSLHPMIDLEKKIVCINIKQSFSKILEYKNNPMMQNCFVPIVGYREVDSTVTLHENDIILLSGFIQIDNFENSNKNGVFQNVLNIKNSRHKKQLSELMIFIRVKFF